MSGIKGPGSAKDPGQESTPGYVGLGSGAGGGPAAQGGGVGKRNGVPTPWAPRAGGPGAWGLAQSRELVLPCPTLPAPTSDPCDAWEHSQKTCSPPGLAWPGGGWWWWWRLPRLGEEMDRQGPARCDLGCAQEVLRELGQGKGAAPCKNNTHCSFLILDMLHSPGRKFGSYRKMLLRSQ